jgi:type II secretory pathway pseudopilin PulG
MFGSGASNSQQQANAQQQFDQLKMKYQSVLNEVERQQVQLHNLHVQDNKLFIKGTAPSEDAKNKLWEQIKLVDQNWQNDLTADFSVDQSRAMGAAAGGGQGQNAQTYTVKSGDNLSKIRRSERVHADLLRESRQAERSGQDPSGPATEHSASLGL